MGATYSVDLVYGLLLEREDCATEQGSRTACGHPNPLGARYCSTCGDRVERVRSFALRPDRIPSQILDQIEDDCRTWEMLQETLECDILDDRLVAIQVDEESILIGGIVWSGDSDESRTEIVRVYSELQPVVGEVVEALVSLGLKARPELHIAAHWSC